MKSCNIGSHMSGNKLLAGQKNRNRLIAIIVSVVNIAAMGILFDFYYDLNDDKVICEILSGRYSGMPSGHNMQMLYPLSELIALCYRVQRFIPWYGLFLLMCQFGCFYLVSVRLLSFCQTGKGKAFTLIILCFFQWWVCLPFLVSITYTVTCGMMSATAIFLFMTTPKESDTKQFLLQNIPAIILVITAFQIRTEMLLLLFPFICLAGFYCMTAERTIFEKDVICRYGAVLGIILGGMLLSGISECVAYANESWRDFRNFFNARTTVYDYYEQLVFDETYTPVLTELGVDRGQQILLNNYNFALDNSIDTELLQRLEDYALHTIGESKDWTAVICSSFYKYISRTLHDGYGKLIIIGYAAVLVAGFFRCFRIDYQFADQKCNKVKGWLRKYDFLWQLILMGIVRSLLWMFILVRGRTPLRITISLYLVEMAMLAALILRIFGKIEKKRGKIILGCCCVVLQLLIVAWILPNELPQVCSKQQRQAKVMQDWYAIDDYCGKNRKQYYFVDVFSYAGIHGKIFDGRDNTILNYDFAGGWMCKSPLYREKLATFGIEDTADALAEGKADFIISDEEVSLRGLTWIEVFYAERGMEVYVEEYDRIGENYGVYQVIPISETGQFLRETKWEQ